jgi:DNA-binding MarR family transcriptional regulator
VPAKDPTARARTVARCCLGVRLRLLARLVTGAYEAHLRHRGVGIAPMNLLVAVAAGGPVSPGELAERMVLEKSTVSRDLRTLIDNGWVTQSKGPGRKKSLAITPAGLAVVDAAFDDWQKGQKDAEKLLGPVLAAAAADVVNRRWGLVA